MRNFNIAFISFVKGKLIYKIYGMILSRHDIWKLNTSISCGIKPNIVRSIKVDPTYLDIVENGNF